MNRNSKRGQEFELSIQHLRAGRTGIRLHLDSQHIRADIAIAHPKMTSKFRKKVHGAIPHKNLGMKTGVRSGVIDGVLAWLQE